MDLFWEVLGLRHSFFLNAHLVEVYDCWLCQSPGSLPERIGWMRWKTTQSTGTGSKNSLRNSWGLQTSSWVAIQVFQATHCPMFFPWNPGLEVQNLSELPSEAGPRNNSKIPLAQDQGERDNCGEFAPPKTRKVGPSDCSACHCSPWL